VSDGIRRWVLSGGIGSGKTSVRTLLENRGIATIDADAIGHLVLESSGPAFEAVAKRWPQVVVDGEIDRDALAGIVFEDADELATLESMTHPYIFDTIQTRVQGIRGLVVVEIPLLRHGLDDGWGRIVVDSDEPTRMRRLIERGVSEHDAEARMHSQPSRTEWLSVADIVVPNHGTFEELTGAVDRLVDALG